MLAKLFVANVVDYDDVLIPVDPLPSQLGQPAPKKKCKHFCGERENSLICRQNIWCGNEI